MLLLDKPPGLSSSMALQQAKRTINQGCETDLATGLAIESQAAQIKKSKVCIGNIQPQAYTFQFIPLSIQLVSQQRAQRFKSQTGRKLKNRRVASSASTFWICSSLENDTANSSWVVTMPGAGSPFSPMS